MPIIKRHFPAIVLLLLLCSFTIPPEAESYFQKGEKDMQDKLYMQAISHFSMAIALKEDYGLAFLERARAKKLMASKTGVENSEVCFDLLQALQLNVTEASALLKENCHEKCFDHLTAFSEPEIVFCGNFSSQLLHELPVGTENLQNIVKLNLFNNKLTRLSPSVYTLHNLLVLDLSSNFITALDPGLKNFRYLEELNLNKNELRSLPAEIGMLSHLTTLSLESNHLISIPAAISKCVNLEHLDLSYNNLTSLPLEIGQLRKLKVLNLTGNKIDKKVQKAIQARLPDTAVYF